MVNILKNYMEIRAIDIWAEISFAKELSKHNQIPYFPFKDVGIDIIGIDNKNKSYFYQIKSRNINTRKMVYGFNINEKKLYNFPSNSKNSFWVFSCYKKNKFDFFVVPYNITKKWYKLRKESCKEKGKYFLDIKPKDNGYELRPGRLNKEIKIMKYLWY
jgi:hypothetical protein